MDFTHEDLVALRKKVAAIDPLLVAAADDVDRRLLRWMQGLSPLERLDAATRAARALHGFRHERPPSAG